jgi:hypothetical protein
MSNSDPSASQGLASEKEWKKTINLSGLGCGAGDRSCSIGGDFSPCLLSRLFRHCGKEAQREGESERDDPMDALTH